MNRYTYDKVVSVSVFCQRFVYARELCIPQTYLGWVKKGGLSHENPRISSNWARITGFYYTGPRKIDF